MRVVLFAGDTVLSAALLEAIPARPGGLAGLVHSPFAIAMGGPSVHGAAVARGVPVLFAPADLRAPEFLEALARLAPDAIVVTDVNRTIVLLNGQVEKLFGYDRSELMGELIETLVPERFRVGHAEKFAAYVREPSFRPMGSGRKLFGQRKDGTEFPVEISLSPLDTDGDRLIICTIRDISGRLLT